MVRRPATSRPTSVLCFQRSLSRSPTATTLQWQRSQTVRGATRSRWKVCIYNQQSVNLSPTCRIFRAVIRRCQVFTSATPTRLSTPGMHRCVPRIVRHPSPDQLRASNNSRPRQLTIVTGSGRLHHHRECSTLVPGQQSNRTATMGRPLRSQTWLSFPIDSDGSFCIYNQQAVNLVVDLQGSFSSSAPQG